MVLQRPGHPYEARRSPGAYSNTMATSNSKACSQVLKWKPIAWATEQGQIRSGVGPFLERRMRDRNAPMYVEFFPTRGDKSVRAQSIRGKLALDGLYVPNAPWRNALISELLHFPAGKHDDQVDALGLVGQLLDRMMPASRPEQPKRRFIVFDNRIPLPGPPEEPRGVRIKI